MPTLVYVQGMVDLTSGAVSGGAPWVSNSYKITLVTSAYTPAISDRYASAFSGFELSTTSFNAGFGGAMRLSIGSRVVSANTTSGQVEFFGGAVTWSGLSAGSVGAAVILRESSTDAVSPLVAYFPMTNILTNGGDFTISAPASGYLVMVSA